MNFIERSKPETKVQVIQHKVPRIAIESDALAKMFVYVDECSDEIGWLGTVEHVEDKYYLIKDVFLFEQDVHGATTEITPEGLSSFAEELLQRPDGIEIWNNMKLWGHSHVNMGVSPSGQDDKQMKEFSEIGHDWFIRLIANKKGDMKLDFFNYEQGVTYLDVPWEEYTSEEENAVLEEIYRLEALLEEHRGKRVELHKSPIKEEMKEKVRKMATGRVGYNYPNYSYANQYGRNINGRWTKWEDEPPTEGEKKMHKTVIPQRFLTTTDGTTGTDTIKKKESGSETRSVGRHMDDEDYFTEDDEVKTFFTQAELVDFCYLTTLEEIEEEVGLMGYYNFFTMNDLERIMRVALKSYGQHIDYYGEWE